MEATPSKGYLAIAPVCLGRSRQSTKDLRISSVLSTRRSLCCLEIVHWPTLGVAESIYYQEQTCYLSEYAADRLENAIGLLSPFYVDLDRLQLPRDLDVTLSPKYEFRFRFSADGTHMWMPLSYHQLHGVDPKEWRHLSSNVPLKTRNLWVAYRTSLSQLHHNSSPIHAQSRLIYESINRKIQVTDWDMRVRYSWRQKTPNNALSGTHCTQ